MMSLLRDKLLEVLKAVAPLIAVVCVLQFTIVHAPTALFLQLLAGAVLAAIGMLLLFAGVDIGIVPMGRFIGAELPKKGSLWLILAAAFALGFATTVAEPDVLVLAGQIDEVSQRRIAGPAVLYVIALGLAVLTAAAMARIVFGWSMRLMLTAVFAVMLVLVLIAPADFIPIAFDAGSATTGVLATARMAAPWC